MTQHRPFAIIALAWTAATLTGAPIAACTSETTHPAQLGNCTHRGELGCVSPVGGAAGAGGGDGGAASHRDAGSGPGTDGGSCGIVDTVFVTNNQACVPCIVSGTASPTGTSCCQADTLCSNNADCVALLECVQMLSPNCGAAHPNGVHAYSDFATCLQMNCPQCPPQSADF